MRAAIINSGVVVNVIELDNLGQYPGAVACPNNDIGDLYDGSTFTKPTPPPPPIPTVVTMRQARLAMLDAGILTSVSDALAAMTGPTGEAARIEWEYSPTLKRDHPLVASLSAALGLTSAQLDGLFTAAAGL